MSESKHTPEKLEVVEGIKIYISFIKLDKLACEIPFNYFTEDFDMSKEELLANAERIVKCWNSHDALLAACEAAQIMLLQSDWNGDPRMNIVGNAIAEAKGA